MSGRGLPSFSLQSAILFCPAGWEGQDDYDSDEEEEEDEEEDELDDPLLDCGRRCRGSPTAVRAFRSAFFAALCILVAVRFLS